MLQLYARALADTADAIAKGGGKVSATLTSVVESLREDIRAEVSAKASDLNAAVDSRDGGIARRAWTALVGTLRDTVFRGADSKLSAVTLRLRNRLPELCAALQVR